MSLLSQIKKQFINREFSVALHNRSDSENGLYLASVSKALQSYKGFSNFKRAYVYLTNPALE